MAKLSDLLVSYKQVEAPSKQEYIPELPMDRYSRLQQYIANRDATSKTTETPLVSDPVEDTPFQWNYDPTQNTGSSISVPMAPEVTVTSTPYKVSNKPEDVMQRALTVANYLHKNGSFSKEQAAAIAGVMIDENNVDPSSYMKAEKAGKGAKGTEGFGYGAGIGSWTFASTKNALLTAGGYKPNTPIESLGLEDQARLLVIDSNGRMKKYYDALRRTNNLEDASATAVLITGGIGKSKNWDTHPTVQEAKELSDWYGRSNDKRFGPSPHHWNADKRRLEYAKRVRSMMG